MAGTNYNAQSNLPNVKFVFTNDDGNVTHAECTGNPNVVATDGGYFVPGCEILRSDFNAGNNLYQNNGTLASPVWNLIPTGGGGGTIGGSIVAPEIAYGLGANAITGDSGATRVVGTLTNISDVFTAGNTSAIQLSNNIFGAGVQGAALTQITSDGQGGIVAGIIPAQSNFTVALDSVATGGGSYAQGIFNGALGVGSVKLSYNGGASHKPSLTLNNTLAGLIFNNGTNTSGITAQSNQLFIGNNGHTWTWPTTLGSAGQVLTDPLGDGTLAWTSAGSGTVTGSGAANQIAIWDTTTDITGSPFLTYSVGSDTFSAGNPAYGSIVSDTNGIHLTVNNGGTEFLNIIDGLTSNVIFTVNPSPSSNPDIAFGDLANAGNSNQFHLNDANQVITAQTSSTFQVLDTEASQGTWVLVNTNGVNRVAFGDLSNLYQQTKFILDDMGGEMHAQVSEQFYVQNIAGNLFLDVDLNNNLYQLGDINDTNNGTFIKIDDAAQTITAQSSSTDWIKFDFPNDNCFIGNIAGDTSSGTRNTYIGNRAGYGTSNATNNTFLGYLAGAYATNASYSFFAGSQAGELAVYAGNSFFFGQSAGINGTVANASVMMGLLSGANNTNAGSSTFIGSNSGGNPTSNPSYINSNNSTFIGSYAGFEDLVNNQGLITYTGETPTTFIPGQPFTSSSGGAGVTVSDDGAGNLVIMDSRGTFNVSDTITETNTGTTMTLVSYRASTSSILIGDRTSTGGGTNSVAIGAGATNAGHDNSIVIGVDGANTLDNQYAWGDSIINWKFGGNNYQLPFYLPGGSGQYLGSSSSGVLNWSVPGTQGGISVVAATTTALPAYTFNNMGGVGDMITFTVTAPLVLDGIPIGINDDVLIKDETGGNAPYNGVYKMTTLNSVLTRTTSADTSAQFNDMVVTPAQGLTQSAVPFGQQTPNPTVDTDPILFTALTGVYLKQQTSGTQAANQIPIYTGTALTLTKGTSDFVYDPVTKNLQIDNTTFNTFIGNGAGLGNISGAENIAISLNALVGITTGNANIGIGVGAGQGVTSGSPLQTGSSNILIGGDADVSTSSTSAAIAIGAGSVGMQQSIALGNGAINTAQHQVIFDPAIVHYTLNLVAYDSDVDAFNAGLRTGDQYQTSGAGIGIFAFVGVTMTKQ